MGAVMWKNMPGSFELEAIFMRNFFYKRGLGGDVFITTAQPYENPDTGGTGVSPGQYTYIATMQRPDLIEMHEGSEGLAEGDLHD